MGKHSARSGRLPALDGLRGLAVALVFLFHTGIGQFRNGFIGVDMFFVLSGFLITSLLLQEHRRAGTIRLSAFYARRMLRLYPALVAVCLFCVAVEIAVGGHHARAVAEGAVAALLYIANIWIYGGHGTVLLQHTWTLALEEQFYVCWPLLLIIALRSRRRAQFALLVLCLGAWVALIEAPAHGELSFIRYTYVRAAGLPLGCLLAFAMPMLRRFPRLARTFAVAGMCFLLVAALSGSLLPSGMFDGSSVSLGAVAAVPVVGAFALPHPGRLGGLFSVAPARWVGLRSYAIYLWHFPLLQLVLAHSTRRLSREEAIILVAAATLIVSEASWRLIESRFTALRGRLTQAPAPRYTLSNALASNEVNPRPGSADAPSPFEAEGGVS